MWASKGQLRASWCLIGFACAAMQCAAQNDYGQTCTQTGYMHLCAKYCVPSTLYYLCRDMHSQSLT